MSSEVEGPGSQGHRDFTDEGPRESAAVVQDASLGGDVGAIVGAFVGALWELLAVVTCTHGLALWVGRVAGTP